MFPSTANMNRQLPAKRRKIQIACELCRVRKSRCDGGRPRCSACLKRRDAGPVCVYYELSSLHFNGGYGTTAGLPYVDGHESSPQKPRSSRIDSGDAERAARHPVANADGHAEDSNWILQAGLLASSNSANFFSTVFGRNSDENPHRMKSPIRAEGAPDVPHQSSGQPMGFAPISDADYILPSRGVADVLVAAFFQHAFIIWLDRCQFQNWYRKLWDVNRQIFDLAAEQINYATLNLMFALEYRNQHFRGTELAEVSPQVYSQRAERLLQLQVLRLDRKDLLWTLLLLIQWYQSVNDTMSCRRTVRLCITIAQNLELDIPERVDELASFREQEMSRRLWHGCVLMDRITSMVSNLPLQIPQIEARRLPLFKSIDDEYLDTDALAQPDGQTSSLDFFHSFCQLHLVLGDMLQHRTRSRSESSTKVDINTMMDIEAALKSFNANLPKSLREGEAVVAENTMSQGPQIHLRSRFLYISILLFRACFTERREQNGSAVIGSFADAIFRQGQIECVSAAQELLELLRFRLTSSVTSKHSLPQWWHTVTYVYTSSTVVIAALSFPHLVLHFKKDALEANLLAAYYILDQYSDQTALAKRCRIALEALATRYHTSRHATMNEGTNRALDNSALSANDPYGALLQSTIEPIYDIDWLLDESLYDLLDQP